MTGALADNTNPRHWRANGFRFFRTTVACSVLWGLMTQWNSDSLVIGAPTVLFAAWVYTKLRNAERPPLPIRPGLRFVVFFVWASLVSGIDIAGRVLAPRVRVAPGFITFTSGLNSLSARVFLANAVSLIPGTLSVGLEGQALRIHVIDVGQPNDANLRKLESLVSELFHEGQATPEESA